jgi:thioredoxin-related protein
MKSLICIAAILLLPSASWLNDFDQARQKAKQNNQLILLNFSGSDWCAPCIKMKKEVFETKQFQEYAEANLVLVRADFPRNKKNQLEPTQKEHNEKLAEQFNPKGQFPLTLLIDSNGNVLHEWSGYSNMSVDTFIDELRSKSNGK